MAEAPGRWCLLAAGPGALAAIVNQALRTVGAVGSLIRHCAWLSVGGAEVRFEPSLVEQRGARSVGEAEAQL